MTVALTGRNPNDVFPLTIRLIKEKGVNMPSRNGPCREVSEPVSVTFTHPQERVLFNRKRRINPYLHFFEPFWLLAGRNDVAFLANIVEKFKDYSDDGKTFWGAYGHRLINPVDQIKHAINRLKADPHDRRVVLQIRQPKDIVYVGKDTPCNTSVALKIRNGKLNMHVFNRSNDAIWGGPAGGTNHPQFTVLQEYLAGHIGCALGTYTVTTDSLHAYIETPDWKKVEEVLSEGDYYTMGKVRPFNLMDDPDGFCNDLAAAFGPEGIKGKFESIYFVSVFMPMYLSFTAFKLKRYDEAVAAAEHVEAEDWKEVTVEWLKRYTEKERDE